MRGLVHGDVKPANVHVCRMGLDYDFVKVLDFGLVKFSGGRFGGTGTSLDRVTSGTPAFMAPEVVVGEADADQLRRVRCRQRIGQVGELTHPGAVHRLAGVAQSAVDDLDGILLA